MLEESHLEVNRIDFLLQLGQVYMRRLTSEPVLLWESKAYSMQK